MDDNDRLARLFEKYEDFLLEKTNEILNSCIPVPIEILLIKRIPFIEEESSNLIILLNQNLKEAISKLEFFVDSRKLVN